MTPLRKAFKIALAVVFAFGILASAIGIGLAFYASWAFHVELTRRLLGVP